MKILIVEDDNYINKLLSDMLSINGYTIKSAYSGTEALIYLSMETFDMVLLDLMLPGLEGENVLKEIRKNNNIPVLIISAKDDKHTKLGILKEGADDFISKPFDIDEVIVRVEVNLRRYRQEIKTDNEVLRYKELNLNKDTREVEVNGKIISLTTREFEILKLLLEHPKKVFTKINIFESVWNEDYLGDDNTLNVHISNLRNKISKCAKNEYIQTIWGIGYKLEV